MWCICCGNDPVLVIPYRPLSEAPVASIAEGSAEEGVSEEAHASDGPSGPDSSPGQVEESQPDVQASDARPAAPQVILHALGLSPVCESV